MGIAVKRDASFRSFLAAYPPVPDLTRKLDGVSLAEAIEERFGVQVPGALQLFWLRVGAGVYGAGELCFFGDVASGLPGPEILAWNQEALWRPVSPAPGEGGPFYFAQTPFGDQLGFRWQDGVALPELFLPDTVESFVLAKDLDQLLYELLVTPGALCEAEKLQLAIKQLGPLPPGQNFVPNTSPLKGGQIRSFHVESASAHLAGAMSTWQLSKAMPAEAR